MKKNQGVFDINATQVMSQKEKNRLIWGIEESHPVRDFFSKVGKFLGRTLLVLLVLNPLLFWLWVLIFPKGMGLFLSDGSFWETPIGTSMKKLSIRTAEKILPTGRLFSFMEKLGPAECSVRNQLRYFLNCCVNNRQWKLSCFSAPAQKRIWAEYGTTPGTAEQLLDQGYTLDEDEKIVLIEKGYINLLMKVWDGKTLSKRVMQALYACRPCDTKELFFSLIAHNGANGIDLTMVCEADRPRLLESLKEFSQVALIRREQQRKEDGGPVFINLIEYEEDLCLRAEKKISLRQYECLLSAGKHLSEEAILYKANPQLNPSDWASWVTLFVSNEDLTSLEFYELVLSNPELRELVLRLRDEDKDEDN